MHDAELGRLERPISQPAPHIAASHTIGSLRAVPPLVSPFGILEMRYRVCAISSRC